MIWTIAIIRDKKTRPVHHEARNWLILTDCSNAFNTVKKTAMLAEAAITHAIHRKMIRREARPCILPNGFGGAAKDRMLQRSAARGRHGPGVVLHAPLLPVLKRIREEF